MEESTETKRPLNTDSQGNHETQQAHPVEHNQQATDKPCLFAFLIFVTVWIGVSIPGFFAKQQTDEDDNDIIQLILSFVNAPVTTLSALLPICVLLCTAFICLCVFIYEKLPKLCIYISMVMFIVGIISSACSLLLPKKLSEKEEESLTDFLEIIFEKQKIAAILAMVYYGIFVVPHLVYLITSVISFFFVETNVLRDIAKNSCWLILRSPALLLFVSIIATLACLIVSFMINVFLVDINTEAEVFDYLGIVTILGGICVLDFVINFGRVVISEYAIEYYSKNERASVIHLSWHILSTYSGTIMFASTMFVNLIVGLIQAIKHKATWRIRENCLFYMITKVSLVMTPYVALEFSSIYGLGFCQAYQKTFNTLLRRPTLYMAMLLIMDGALVIITAVVLIVATIVITICIEIISEDDDNYVENLLNNASLAVYGFGFPIIVFGLMIPATMKALLIHKIITLNEKDCDTEEKHEMLNRC